MKKFYRRHTIAILSLLSTLCTVVMALCAAHVATSVYDAVKVPKAKAEDIAQACQDTQAGRAWVIECTELLSFDRCIARAKPMCAAGTFDSGSDDGGS